MKRIGLILILLGLATIYSYPQDSIVSIPDTAFLHALIDEGVDTSGDGLISYAEAEAVTSLYISGEWICNADSCWSIGQIASLEGIEAFINLDTLDLYANKLTSLDVSKNIALIRLDCGGNRLTSLDVSNNIALKELHCNQNQLTSLDIINNSALIELHFNHNQLTSLDVSNNKDLEYLSCWDNQLSNLDVSSNTALRLLKCSNNQLTSLDLSGDTALEYLGCFENKLTNLDVSNNTILESLNCWGNQLTSLDVSNNIDLILLSCDSNQLSDLDVSANTYLNWLGCSGNNLTSLDISNNTALTYLSCNDNNLTSLDVSNSPILAFLGCGNNQLTNLDISNNTLIGSGSCGPPRCWGSLRLEDMPSLHEVCVWTTPFPPDTVSVNTTGSPNICFETDCDGVCEPTDLEELWNGDFSIYPNPTNTLLTIETGFADLCNIEITSLNGKLLFNDIIEGTAHQLDLSSFQKGVYFITISSKDFVTTRKIVKL